MLLQAEDGNKDQTYFLCGVPREGLAKVKVAVLLVVLALVLVFSFCFVFSSSALL